MSLSAEITRRLQWATEHQDEYMPNDTQRRGMGKVSLWSIIGIMDAGKTTIASNAYTLAPDKINPVITETTRPRRSWEVHDVMHFVPHDDEHLAQILDEIERGEFAQYVVHPTGYIYGTRLQDYEEGKYNIMPTVASTVHYLSTLPYGEYRKIFVVPDIIPWLQIQTATNYPPDQALKRLEEGEVSLMWALEHKLEIQWLHNKEGSQQNVAHRFLALLEDPSQSDHEAIAIAHRLLDVGVRPMLNRARGL